MNDPLDIIIEGTDKIQQYEELVKVFLQPGEYTIRSIPEGEAGRESGTGETLRYAYQGDWMSLSRHLYEDLARITGKRPKWGILTGIRPVKLADEMGKPGDEVRRLLEDDYLLHGSKAGLVTEILEYQRKTAGSPPERSLALYAGIPFCPTRCLYCSFPSYQGDRKEYGRYLEALKKEIAFCGESLPTQWTVESVYMGGGTPTELSAEELDGLLGQMRRSFDLSSCREFTVEGGRPDTFTEEKLAVLRRHGADRLSINPQTMQQRTLDLIGRRHTDRKSVV